MKDQCSPHNKQDMIQQIEVVWNEVFVQQLQALIANILDQMQAIIQAKGGSTRW